MKFTIATLFILATVSKTTKAQPAIGFLQGSGTPDSFTPGANGFLSICENYEKKAKALCNFYCLAQDCYLGEDEINVPQAVCDAAYASFLEETGEDPPCMQACPCFELSDFDDLDLTCTFFPSPDGNGGISQIADGVLFPPDGATANFLALAGEGDFPICAIGDPNAAPDIIGFITTEQAEACNNIVKDLFGECPDFDPPSPPTRK